MARGVPCRACSTPIDETSRYGRTPARSAASASRTAAAWSTVCLRSAPLPGPAPAAKTTAAAPRTTSATAPTAPLGGVAHPGLPQVQPGRLPAVGLEVRPVLGVADDADDGVAAGGQE